MDKVIVTITGILSIIGIYWFFFGKKEEAMEIQESTTIIVDGGYKPNALKIKQGKPVTITFIRKDPNPCLDEIIFPDYKIKEYLPVNKPVTITLPPPHSGKSGFHCGMNMFHGQIIVEEHA
ncbi:cupredoxin domain-containing protein [Candidatus Gottesmanbacteria bacterium]|nr:cupredoxin domain-containing protein [Candidatus Gottesmanbacteria bacterium]